MDAKTLISNLRKFQTVLAKLASEDWHGDYSGIDKAISKIELGKVNGSPLSFNVNQLTFKLPIRSLQHTIPENCSSAKLFLSLNIGFSNSTFNISELKKLNIDIEVISTQSDSGDQFKSTWHLDFHNTDLKESFSHPRFHFQFGGKGLRLSPTAAETRINSGELLIIEPPRLVHPPMDLILAFDFVISNFVGVECWQKLRSIPMFQNLHRTSEQTFWKPYFTEMADYFSENTANGNDAKFLNPGFGQH